MALWFAETRARGLVNDIESVFHVDNQYVSPRDKEKQLTIDLDYLSQQSMLGGGSGEWWS
jgi:hypothetical protein